MPILVDIGCFRKVFKFMKKFVKKGIFFLDHGCARLYVKKSFSNFFITLTDMKNAVIYGFTSGNTSNFFSKKKKISPYIVETIFRKLLIYLKFYKIKKLEIFLRLRISTHIYFLIRELTQYGFFISKIVVKRLLPHNGVRARKSPRK